MKFLLVCLTETAVASHGGCHFRTAWARHAGGGASGTSAQAIRNPREALFSKRSGVFCARFAQVVVSRAPTLVLRQYVLSHREGKRAGSRWKILGPRVLHSALAVVCGRPRALTVRLLCAWHTTRWARWLDVHGGCECRRGMPFPPAPQVGLASGGVRPAEQVVILLLAQCAA